MKYRATYKDQNNQLVSEILTSSYEQAWRHCISKTFDSANKAFMLTELSETDDHHLEEKVA